MESVYLMLGSNVGDRAEHLRRSIALLNNRAGSITGMSSVYESEPWGFDDPVWFLNQAVKLETNLTPRALLEITQQIEHEMGRIRTGQGYEARTMDIDILFHGNLVMETPELIIPHPRIAERMFVLKPLAELTPDLRHPVLHKTIRDLAEHCLDTLKVIIYKEL